MRNRIGSTRRPVVTAIGVAALLCGTLASAAGLPAVQSQNGVAYLTGGVGAGSAHAIQAEARHWPLTMEFAVKDKPVDSYLANVQVQVVDARQRVVLDTVSDGPFLLARLAPGRYEIKATFDGKTLDHPLQLRAGQTAHQTFVWPHADIGAAG